MPNPTGVNNFDHFAPEPAYGQKLQNDQLQRAAAMPAVPALGAPKRAQRATQRRGQPEAQPAPMPSDVNPALTSAQMWQAIAATPGASQLVQQIAMEAQRG